MCLMRYQLSCLSLLSLYSIIFFIYLPTLSLPPCFLTHPPRQNPPLFLVNLSPSSCSYPIACSTLRQPIFFHSSLPVLPILHKSSNKHKLDLYIPLFLFINTAFNVLWFPCPCSFNLQISIFSCTTNSCHTFQTIN